MRPANPAHRKGIGAMSAERLYDLFGNAAIGISFTRSLECASPGATWVQESAHCLCVPLVFHLRSLRYL